VGWLLVQIRRVSYVRSAWARAGNAQKKVNMGFKINSSTMLYCKARLYKYKKTNYIYREILLTRKKEKLKKGIF